MQHKSNDATLHSHTLEVCRVEVCVGGGGVGGGQHQKAGQLVNQQAVILHQRVSLSSSVPGRGNQLKCQMTPTRVPIIIVVITVIIICFTLSLFACTFDRLLQRSLGPLFFSPSSLCAAFEVILLCSPCLCLYFFFCVFFC